MTRQELKDIINECLDEREIIESYNNYFNLFNCKDQNILNEKIDIDTGEGNKLRPVFIVLLYSGSTFTKVANRVVKNQTYWHAGLAFGASLNIVYSFNTANEKINDNKGGLSFESLSYYTNFNPNSSMEVSCVYLNKDKYNYLKQVLNYYIENKVKNQI